MGDSMKKRSRENRKLLGWISFTLIKALAVAVVLDYLNQDRKEKGIKGERRQYEGDKETGERERERVVSY